MERTMHTSAYLWFRKYGYAGASNAAHAARAEKLASDLGWTYEWVWDRDADWSWMDEHERRKDHEVEGCILRDAKGNELGSLWGIFDADSPYRRVVQAELASEAQYDIRQQSAQYDAFLARLAA